MLFFILGILILALIIWDSSSSGGSDSVFDEEYEESRFMNHDSYD